MAETKAKKRAFAKRVAALRDQLGLSQMDLGEKVGVSGTCVWNWEQANTFPRPSALKKLSKSLKTTVEFLADGASDGSLSNVSEDQTLSDVILKAREMVAAAAGVSLSDVRVILDVGN